MSTSDFAHPAPIRDYQVNLLTRLFSIFFSCVSLLVTASLVREYLDSGTIEKPLNVLFVAIFVGASIFILVYSFYSSISVSTDSITVVTPWSTSKLPLDKIHGRREYVSYGGKTRTRYLVLASNDDRFKSIEFAKRFNFDQDFYDWFYSLKDLDAVDKELGKKNPFGTI